MKKLIIFIAIILAGTSVFAQKYMTRTGKISFYSSTPVENIEAFNNEVASVMDGKTGDMIFQLLIKNFKFDNALMQDHFNESYMESDKYPKADFKGKISNAGNINFVKDGSYPAMTVGKLTMHGVTKDISVPGTIVVKGGVVTAKSKFKIVPQDYNIKIPAMVAGKIAKEIEITVDTELKPIQK